MHPITVTPPPARLETIERSRRAVMDGAAGGADAAAVAPWIERSWRRCLQQGQRPGHRLAFDVLPSQAERRAEESQHELLLVARPAMAQLAQAIARTRYFTLLTDARGVVLASDGPIDRSDPRAQLITRVGVDLSERAVGTSAIGAALDELQPVWLHRGEHFYQDTSCYSCAGAPLFGPNGDCVGMLDVTGIDAAERPELRHLVAQAARGIENGLVQARPHALLLRLRWPGAAAGDEDALLGVDADGWVVAANTGARQMLAGLAQAGTTVQPAPVHCSELFALAWEALFDAAGQAKTKQVPLWSGLNVQLLSQRTSRADAVPTPARWAMEKTPLKDLETELIHQAVRTARGNVMEAARVLGISRATIYRRLNRQAGGSAG